METNVTVPSPDEIGLRELLTVVVAVLVVGYGLLLARILLSALAAGVVLSVGFELYRDLRAVQAGGAGLAVLGLAWLVDATTLLAAVKGGVLALAGIAVVGVAPLAFDRR